VGSGHFRDVKLQCVCGLNFWQTQVCDELCRIVVQPADIVDDEKKVLGPGHSLHASEQILLFGSQKFGMDITLCRDSNFFANSAAVPPTKGIARSGDVTLALIASRTDFGRLVPASARCRARNFVPRFAASPARRKTGRDF
jgi:hypothetical protein